MRSKSITIREVPARVHRELAARAARRGQSLQEYLLGELERHVAHPSMADLMDEVRARKRATRTRLPAAKILEYRDADRT
jgi:plasmid stability protein